MQDLCAYQSVAPLRVEDDSIEMATLPAESLTEMRRWMDALKPAIDGPRAGRGKRISEAAQVMGVSLKTARRKFDLYKATGWRGLVNWAKAGTRDVGIPVETVRWLKGLCENYGGNFRRAYDTALGSWRCGTPVPGYHEWPKPGVYGRPAGWSYANLQRIAGPTQAEKRLARIGRSAAKSCMPLVITTRVGLHPGQIVMADDLWHDIDTSMIGINKALVRPIELCMLDLFSASKICYGIKPRIRDEVTGKRVNLKESDMRFMLAYWATQIGYWPEGCQLVLEHGTAAASDDVEKLLSDHSGGKIVCNRSGIEDKPAILGAWRGNQHGNFRLKAALESSHNLPHNYARYLAGQTGSNSREDRPEEHSGREASFNALVRAIDAVIETQPADRIAWLLENIRPQFPPYFLYTRIVDMLYKMIDQRHNHDLEGWEEAGLISGQYRLAINDLTWFDDSTLSAVDPERRAAIEAIVNSNAGLHQWRKQSPAEVWAQRSPLKKLGDHMIPMLCGQDLAVERKVTKRGTFELDDKEISPSTMVFVAIAQNPYGHKVLLEDEETYNTFVNPFDPTKLFVCDARLRYIGVCTRQVAVSRADTHAIVRAMGEAAHNESVRLAEYRLRHESEADDAEAIRSQNAMALKKITSGAAVTRAEKDEEEKLDAVTVDAGGRAAATEHAAGESPEEFSAEDIAGILRTTQENE